MFGSPFGSTATGGVINLRAAATSATSVTLVDVATGANVVVPAGRRLVIAGGMMTIGGSANTVLLEDEDGVDLSPVITSQAAATGFIQVLIPPTRLPTVAKNAKITTTGATVVATFWGWGYLEG
jgi:hypothetical protein